MKYCLLCFLLIFSLTSCTVTESMTINENGEGTITVNELRDEQSYMQWVGEDYNKENFYKDSTYVVQDLIAVYAETFARLPDFEKEIFRQYNRVKVHEYKSAVEKIFRNTITYSFKKVNTIPDLYKAIDYADDIVHNYALSAEEHYYKVAYFYDGNIFKRTVIITNPVELEKQKASIGNMTKQYAAFKVKQDLILEYHFSKPIKSVSHPAAQISSDRKSVTIQLILSDCLINPESSSVEVVFD